MTNERISEIWRQAMQDLARGFFQKSFVPGERSKQGDTLPLYFAHLLLAEVTQPEALRTTPEIVLVFGGFVVNPDLLDDAEWLKGALEAKDDDGHPELRLGLLPMLTGQEAVDYIKRHRQLREPL